LMLSWETTIWKFPIEAVKIMNSTIKEAEKYVEYKHFQYSDEWLKERDIEKKVLISYGIEIWQSLKADALLIMTKTWRLARITGSFRPNIPIFAFTPEEKTSKIMRLYYWINPIHLNNWEQKDYGKTLDRAIKYLLKNKLIKKDSKIIAITDLQREWKEIPVLEVVNVEEVYR
jgi:pyruvate kinase